jgi:N-acylneuraminate cytidylyltransferase
VIRHAIEWLGGSGIDPEFVCCLYATAPMVEVDDLRRSLDRLQRDPDLEFVFPVTSWEFPVFRALRIVDDRTTMFWPEYELTRSQDLPEAWHDAGQFYFGRRRAFLERDGFFSARSAPLILPRNRVQDIDSEEDWIRAESLFRLQGVPR